ncbi:MAG TPA: helicase HerA-like domain-containing protein [Isosphaeraceae bacterium]|jgi:hypothetical protein|nr:helicase HerA-like domain-containing protein [Isosphaeraceae bacterium]
MSTTVDDDGAPAAPQPSPAADPRVAAFCSAGGPEVFRPIAHRREIERADPLDVATIHDEARTAFRRLVDRATGEPGPAAGRILLLKGEAGSGKTHLMRAFRNWAHGRGAGYCGYMQMTSATEHYSRYVLGNLIDSLDQPYDRDRAPTSALMRLSTAIAEGARGVAVDRVEQLRQDDLGPDCLARLVDALADQIVLDDRFDRVDFDLLRALLYLQRDDPRVRARVLKYLRCEPLTAADRQVIGGLAPRVYGEAASTLVEKLGDMMRAVDSAALVLLVDQLEDVYNEDDAPRTFRRALAALRDVTDRVPSSVVVIACLSDFYESVRGVLTQSLLDRVEKDPAPINLRANIEADEVVELVGRRLEYLHESAGAPFEPSNPTYPIPEDALRALAGQRARRVLEWCQEYRERCVAAGAMVPAPGLEVEASSTTATAAGLSLEQEWNDFRSTFAGVVPDEEAERLRLLAWAIVACSDEDDRGRWFTAEAEGNLAAVERHDADGAVDRLLVALCDRAAQGGGLGRQIAAVEARASAEVPVVVPIIARSTDFPKTPQSQVVRQLGELLRRGGRKVVVADSDWRAMVALREFLARKAPHPDLAPWRKAERPLGRLESLRTILDLDRAPGLAPTPTPSAAPAPMPIEPAEPVAPPAIAPAEVGPIVVGTTRDRAAAPLTIDPEELTRHAAFLGGTGSGKTTVALNIVEQLLLRGVPAVLVDRKGDLCGYAEPGPWPMPPDEDAADRARRLRERVDVALFTPGNPDGRPLSIAVAPAGLGRLPEIDRQRIAAVAAAALAGMLNYNPKGADQSRQVILAKAIEQLALLKPDDAVAIGDLIDLIHEQDPALIAAIGHIDLKHIPRLVNDLATLQHGRGALLSAQGERLDPEALLGLGPHAVAGRTRLSVVSTRFLGGPADVQFWVAQLLVELGRWAGRSPSKRLQAVALFDEADLYLPATRRPATKEPMEDLLRRARSAGLGILLASQGPGDFDYKCRDNVRAWFVGRIKEQTALNKMRPMLAECRVDVAARLPGQEPGEFHLLRDGDATPFVASRCALPPEQAPEDRILSLARLKR